MYISKKECINKENTYFSKGQNILFHVLFNYKYLQQRYINSLHQFTIHVFKWCVKQPENFYILIYN